GMDGGRNFAGTIGRLCRSGARGDRSVGFWRPVKTGCGGGDPAFEIRRNSVDRDFVGRSSGRGSFGGGGVGSGRGAGGTFAGREGQVGAGTRSAFARGGDGGGRGGRRAGDGGGFSRNRDGRGGSGCRDRNGGCGVDGARSGEGGL